MDYKKRIEESGLTIFHTIAINDELYIPNHDLEQILNEHFQGMSLAGLPLRTRSKKVNQEICLALGYPIPKSFKRTPPKFPAQNFDVYTQKSRNMQIWNNKIDLSRRYVILRVQDDDIVSRVKVVNGSDLAPYDKTGTITTKYQARKNSFGTSVLLSKQDTAHIRQFLKDSTPISSIMLPPNHAPTSDSLLPIDEVYNRLLPLIGKSFDWIDALQERNRGASLHKLVCEHLGYHRFSDNGAYPDILNQLLEVKLQTSPTIDLGEHSPDSNSPVISVGDFVFVNHDIRYVVFDAHTEDNRVHLNHLYVVTGYDFYNHFPQFGGLKKNGKIQFHLPPDFFN